MQAKHIKVLGASFAVAVVVYALLPLDTSVAIHLENALIPPGDDFLLGTDILGRSMVRQIMLGLQTSIRVGLIVTLCSTIVGTFLGLMASEQGTITGIVLSWFIDMALTAMLGASFRNLVLAFVVLGWTGYARVIRGEALKIRSQEFVLYARTLGVSRISVAVKHILPHVIPLLLVQMAFGFGAVILGESTLSFLGLGDPTLASLGKQLSEGVDYQRVAMHLVLVPGFILSSLILGINSLGDALQGVLMPNSRR